MKKLSVSLIVMLLATVACANEVDILLKDEGDGVLGVYYDVNEGASTSVPVAYSLTFTLSDGATAGIAEADIIYQDPCYPVYIDYAHDAVGPDFDPASWDPLDPCYTIGEGVPVANPNAAGVPAAASDSFSICMGRLDENQTPGPVVETCLVKIQLADGGTGSTDVTVAEDTLRGGVVGSDFAITTTYEDGDWTTVAFGGCYTEGMVLSNGITVTAQMVTTWNNAGQPASWCTSCQPLGNSNGDAFIDASDVQLLLPSFAQSLGQPAYNPDCDYNHDGFVDASDVQILLPNFATSCP